MKKQILRILVILILILITIGVLKPSLFSNSETKAINRVMHLSGSNWAQLDSFLNYEKHKPLGLKAARFLISNMNEDKFSYEGSIIKKYDTILSIFANLRKEGINLGDPPIITNTWNWLISQYGVVDPDQLEKKYDYASLSAYDLIENTDMAFKAWNNAPSFVDKSFSTFCNYILPYRINNEHVERFRRRYYNKYKELVDTSSSPLDILKGFSQEFVYHQQFRSSAKLWDYPLEYSISQMEIGRRGGCRQLTTYAALVMRACGLPVTIDRAVWANRSVGHLWNVMLLDSGKFLPFDAFAFKKIEFAYKPAKIFRKRYSFKQPSIEDDNLNEIPKDLIDKYEDDVTEQYCKAYNLDIPITKNHEKYKENKLGVICVFDDSNWRIVYYGEIKSGSMHFKKMASGVAYLAAFYDDGEIIPASDPFLLRENGKIDYCRVDTAHKITMNLTRKYPMFKRVEGFAWGLRRTNFEASNYSDFHDSTVFFSIYAVPYGVTDSTVKPKKSFRYIRFRASDQRQANYADVEFYGKKIGSPNAKEEKLTGKIIGYPTPSKDNLNPYTNAMDGNLETWFEKKKDSLGWVGLDLGRRKRYLVTRVRFCPRSDTNFILDGDIYELLYWDDGWKSFGVKKASESVITFKNVPLGTLYILHDQSRGKEERIFTFENGKQMWW